MKYPKMVMDREKMIRFLRSMANDLESGGTYSKGSVQFQTRGASEVTVTYSITGTWTDTDRANATVDV